MFRPFQVLHKTFSINLHQPNLLIVSYHSMVAHHAVSCNDKRGLVVDPPKTPQRTLHGVPCQKRWIPNPEGDTRELGTTPSVGQIRWVTLLPPESMIYMLTSERNNKDKKKAVFKQRNSTFSYLLDKIWWVGCHLKISLNVENRNPGDPYWPATNIQTIFMFDVEETMFQYFFFPNSRCVFQKNTFFDPHLQLQNFFSCRNWHFPKHCCKKDFTGPSIH